MWLLFCLDLAQRFSWIFQFIYMKDLVDSEILHTFAGRTRRKDDELNDDVTMDTLHIIAVVALIIIGGYIYWNKTRG